MKTRVTRYGFSEAGHFCIRLIRITPVSGEE